MSEYKPITGEIREQMEQAERIYPIVDGMQNTQVRINLAWLTERLDAIDAIHAALEAECERLRGEWDFWESTHVELPKDADGVPIHIGDVLERGERHGEVIALMLSDNPWGDGNHWAIQLEGEHAPTVFDSLFHRYVPDTWERIIEDAIDAVDDCWANDEHDKLVDALVARCKALAGDAE